MKERQDGPRLHPRRTLASDWDDFWTSGVKSFKEETTRALVSAHGRLTIDRLEGLAPASRILEAGCGLGNWVSIFSSLGFSALGVDVSQSALRSAVRDTPSGTFLRADIRALPLANESVDFVVSYGVIEHFPDPLPAILEYYRVLRPGGLCLITTPNPWCFHGVIGRHVLNLTRSVRLGYTGYETSYTPEALARLLTRAGLDATEDGLLPEGALFGMGYPLIPVIGTALFRSIKRISFAVERRQRLLGTGSYAIGAKD